MNFHDFYTNFLFVIQQAFVCLDLLEEYDWESCLPVSTTTVNSPSYLLELDPWLLLFFFQHEATFKE